jgi:hypothetical protein
MPDGRFEDLAEIVCSTLIQSVRGLMVSFGVDLGMCIVGITVLFLKKSIGFDIYLLILAGDISLKVYKSVMILRLNPVYFEVCSLSNKGVLYPLLVFDGFIYILCIYSGFKLRSLLSFTILQISNFRQRSNQRAVEIEMR